MVLVPGLILVDFSTATLFYIDSLQKNLISVIFVVYFMAKKQVSGAKYLFLRSYLEKPFVLWVSSSQRQGRYNYRLNSWLHGTRHLASDSSCELRHHTDWSEGFISFLCNSQMWKKYWKCRPSDKIHLEWYFFVRSLQDLANYLNYHTLDG